jgi:hypothetical protein
VDWVDRSLLKVRVLVEREFELELELLLPGLNILRIVLPTPEEGRCVGKVRSGAGV